MQQGVSRPVRHTAAAVGLAPLPVLETLTPKGSLVDLPVFGAAERHAKVFQLRKMSNTSLISITVTHTYSKAFL